MEQHCCDRMHIEVERVCEQHPVRHDCPDCLVEYHPAFDEYGLLVHDGGSSVILIAYCPWCGSKLPESKRDVWFSELEALGFENPLSRDDLPELYRSAKWRLKCGKQNQQA